MAFKNYTQVQARENYSTEKPTYNVLFFVIFSFILWDFYVFVSLFWFYFSEQEKKLEVQWEGGTREEFRDWKE